jgi:hypothetical protein
MNCVRLLIFIALIASCKRTMKRDYDLVGISYNRVIQNPSGEIRIVGASPVCCEIYKTYIISKDTLYFYSYSDSSKKASYRYLINDKFSDLLNRGLLNLVDTVKKLKDKIYKIEPITLFDQKGRTLNIKNYQRFLLDNDSGNLIDSLSQYFNSVETKALMDTTLIFDLNRKIEKFNCINRQPDIIKTVH